MWLKGWEKIYFAGVSPSRGLEGETLKTARNLGLGSAR
jgi:hypothetical protein